jgi:hypothetical protein
MKQLNLFESKGHYCLSPRSPALILSQSDLVRWKARIHDYQQQTRSQPPPQQTSLFEAEAEGDRLLHCLDPFALPRHPSLFWRMKETPSSWAGSNRGCLYFIVDASVPLLLYIGETKHSAHQRWSGTHDCKDYILNYLQLHRNYGLDVAVTSCFWQQLPTDKSTLQQWERSLIYKWRSPFNKEMWSYWGQPFGKIAISKA